MRGSPARAFVIALLFMGWALPALAQNSPDAPPAGRDASFLPSGTSATPDTTTGFSGLAAAPLETTPPSPLTSAVSSAPAPASPAATPTTAPATTTAAAPAATVPDLKVEAVAVAPLPNISPESIGSQNEEGLGADMWKGTPRPLAEYLVSITALTSSPVLNNLTRHLLTTAAAPPEGAGVAPQSLTSMRVEKLVAFGRAADAWSLAKHADAKLIDDITYHFAAEHVLALGSDEPCAESSEDAKRRTGADWQKLVIVCQLRAKDTKTAQVALDVLRADPSRDVLFLDIADKNVLAGEKKLPHQLTPLTPPTLALLELTGLPLPGELYAHFDAAITPALLRAPALQDVAQLALAEHAAEKGIISATDLAAIYGTINFSADALAAPLIASESGLRQHALLFRSAMGEKDPQKRISYTLKFVSSTSPAFLNGVGEIAATMLGTIKADPALSTSAVALARIYMLAGQGETAVEWLKAAQTNSANAGDLLALWPQLALGGLETESGFAADINRWLDAALKPSNPQADTRAARESASTILLLLDAAGFKIPDTAWSRVLETPHNEKHFAFSPALFERLQVAGSAGRRAETVLLATDLAGDGEISLPVAIAITRALHQAGFKSEAARFAREAIALLTK